MAWTKYVVLTCDSQISADCETEPGFPAAIGDLPQTVAEAKDRGKRTGWRNLKGVGFVCPRCYEELTEDTQ